MSLEFRVPDDLDAQVRANLYAAELRRGLELMADGRISRIWRVSGTPDNVGIWIGESAQEVEVLLQTLPLARFMTARITALEEHPLTKAAGS